MHTFPASGKYCRREENCHAHFIHPHRYPLQYPDSRHPSHGKAPARRNGADGICRHNAPCKPRRRSHAGDRHSAAGRADSDSGGAVHGAAAVRSGLPQRARAKTAVRQAGHSDGKRAAFAGQHEKNAHHTGRADRVCAHGGHHRPFRCQIRDSGNRWADQHPALHKI